MSEPISTLPGDRWSCCSTGACCHAFQLGPVDPDLARSLEARGITRDWAPAAAGWVVERPGPDGAVGLYLVQRPEGGCVFLRSDRLCAVHALYGEAAKPSFCREFPLHLVRDPRGLRAVVRPACAGLHEGFHSGAPVGPQAEAAAALPRHVPVREFAPHQVEVLPGVRWELDPWLDAEADLGTLVHAEDDGPEAAVARLRRELARRALATLPVPDPHRQALAFAAILEALTMLLGHVLGSSQGAPPDQVAFVRQAAEQVDAARQAPAALAPLDGPARSWAHMLLRTELHGHLWHAQGSVPAGLGLWLFGVRLARAATAGQPPTPATLAQVHSPWTHLSAHPAVVGVLRRARPALVDLFLHACADGSTG